MSWKRETPATIDNWYGRVEKENDLITVPLNRDQRCAHLPEMSRDIVRRLRSPLPLGTRALTSDAAHDLAACDVRRDTPPP
jgi:hypothetical protein